MRGEPIASQPKPTPKLLKKRKAEAKADRDWWKLRREVLARDRHMCRACGSSNGLEAHHVIFRSLGGPHTVANLITLCAACHKSVHGHVLVLRWRDPLEPAKTIRFEWVK